MVPELLELLMVPRDDLELLIVLEDRVVELRLLGLTTRLLLPLLVVDVELRNVLLGRVTLLEVPRVLRVTPAFLANLLVE